MLPNHHKANILLVDDNLSNLLSLRAVLDSPDYNLIETTSGAEAVKLCEEQEFALIVLDVNMPIMDGFETAKQIKDCNRNKDAPIIFVTATYREDPFIKKGFAVGAIDYFGKPFDPDILKTKVEIYIQLYLRTKRLQETEELLKTHAQIKTLLEAMPVGVIIANADGEIYESNEEARRIWGGIRHIKLEKFDEYKGWWVESGLRLTAEEWGLARALTKGESSTNELIDIETFDGQKKTILNSSFPIRAKGGQILGAIVVLQDFSEQREFFNNVARQAKTLHRDTHAH